MEALLQLPEYVQYTFLALFSFVLLYIGFKSGSIISTSKHRVNSQTLEEEHKTVQQGITKLWDHEKQQLKDSIETLNKENDSLNTKLEEYRKKIAGMGLLNFSGNKKRSDILYSLLLENEALEQIISSQGEKLLSESQSNVQQRLFDLRKRQRLMAEIFNDDTIKNYVQETLKDELGKEDAPNEKIEQNSDNAEHQIKKQEE